MPPPRAKIYNPKALPNFSGFTHSLMIGTTKGVKFSPHKPNTTACAMRNLVLDPKNVIIPEIETFKKLTKSNKCFCTFFLSVNNATKTLDTTSKAAVIETVKDAQNLDNPHSIAKAGSMKVDP